MGTRNIPLEYEEEWVTAVYEESKKTTRSADGRLVFVHANQRDVAEAISTEERTVTPNQVLQLWRNFGWDRKGFLKDVEWRMKKKESLANKMPNHVRKRFEGRPPEKKAEVRGLPETPRLSRDQKVDRYLGQKLELPVLTRLAASRFNAQRDKK